MRLLRSICLTAFAALSWAGASGVCAQEGHPPTPTPTPTPLPQDAGSPLPPVAPRWLIIERDGRAVSPVRFQGARGFSGGLAAVQLSNGRWGYIDARGRMQVNAVYDKAEPMRDGFALVAGFPRFEGGQLLERGFQALVARSGGELTRIYNDDAESAFDELGEFSSGFAPVRKGANWGFIDREGKAAVPLKFERVRPFAGRFGAAKLNGQWGFVDKFGKFSRMPALPAPHLRTFDGGAQFSLDGTHWGIVRAPDGEIISNPKWADLLPFSDRRAVYRTGQALGAIDDLGETAVNPIYHALGPFTESLGRYQLEPHGPFGFVDRRGKIAIEGQFDEVLPFSNGLAAARIGDRWGYIDRNGDPQLAFRYSEATPFEEGVAFVRE